MTFFDRYEMLCAEHEMKPQTQEMLDILGVTSPTISGWKKGSAPKIDAICKLSRYFNVSSDYLLGLSGLRNPAVSLTEEETLLLAAYQSASTQGKFHIIQVCMNERTVKGESVAI